MAGGKHFIWKWFNDIIVYSLRMYSENSADFLLVIFISRVIKTSSIRKVYIVTFMLLNFSNCDYYRGSIKPIKKWPALINTIKIFGFLGYLTNLVSQEWLCSVDLVHKDSWHNKLLRSFSVEWDKKVVVHCKAVTSHVMWTKILVTSRLCLLLYR
jgi:hypothetical protein